MKKKLFGIFALSSVLALASCGAKSKERDTFVTACEKVIDTLQAKETKLTSLTVSDEDFYVLKDTKELTIVKTMVYFIELLYKNESYPVSDKAVYSTANYVSGEETLQYNKQAIKAHYSEKESNIEIEYLGSTAFDENFNNVSLAYLCLNVDYDFNNQAVNSYTLSLGEVEAEKDDLGGPLESVALNLHIYEVYDGSEIYSLKYNSNKKETIENNCYDKLNALAVEAKGLESSGDFSNEYTKATNDMLGTDYFKKQ